MNETKLFQQIVKIFVISAITILFFACPDELKNQEQQDKATVLFLVMDNSARTVLPQDALSDVTSYKLLGGRNGTAEIVLVESFTDTGISISLDPGTWNFTLNAYNNSGENILQGKIQNKQINLIGVNQVNFSLSFIKSGTGSIQITLNFPEIAGITKISANGDVSSEDFTPITAGNFVYTKNEIAAGDYFINFELYREDILRTVISELVVVRKGLNSSKNITLVGEDLKPLYLTGTVTINPAVSVTIGTELTAVYNGTETVVYQWNKDDSAISGATSEKFTPDSNGSYNVTISVAGYYTSVTSAAVTVVGLPTIVQGNTLQAKLEWLSNNAERYSNYVLEASEDETIPSFTLSYSDKSNINITLKSSDSLRIISFSGSGAMFTVGTGVTLILDNITLKRFSSSGNLVSVNGTLEMYTGSAITGGSVSVNNNGTFTMSGGEISGNSGSGVSFSGGSSGTFTMSGGEISGNNGSGVFFSGKIFTMSGGKISGNRSGVGIERGTFTMSGGEISGNTGSGVSIFHRVTFTMSGGKISGNTSFSGGGVYIFRFGTFIMTGGEISGNTATNTGSSTPPSYGGGGGGVYLVGTYRSDMILQGESVFRKSGGIIKDNMVKNSSGTLVNNRGHQVFAYAYNTYNTNEVIKRKETNVGSEVNLFFDGRDGEFSGGGE